MCEPVLRILIYCILLLVMQFQPVTTHIPSYQSTPPSKVDQYCELSDTCIHDTIPICGKMGDEKKTFLDLCDLLEYVCDTNNIYIHVDDMEGCPVPRKKA